MTVLSLQVTAKDFRGPHGVEIYPLREELTGKMGTALVVLLCAAAALLLIACLNLATFRRKNDRLRRFDPAGATTGRCKVVHFPALKHF